RILSDSKPPDWHRSPPEVKQSQQALLQICGDYGLQLSDVAIKFATNHPDIATTIVGMCNTTEVKRNLDALDLQIPDALLKEIARVVAPVKNRMWYEGKEENNLPKK